jgi:hypothetical protein
MGQGLSSVLDKPLLQSLSAWIGFFGFMIGMCQFQCGSHNCT